MNWNNMSTTQCETGIVRMRVGLLNDILRFNYDLYTIFFYVMDSRFRNSIRNPLEEHKYTWLKDGNERDVHNVGREYTWLKDV